MILRNNFVTKVLHNPIICYTFADAKRQCPDGGIGRRAGLKHQWGNPSRFEPGSGYRIGEKFASLLFLYITLS